MHYLTPPQKQWPVHAFARGSTLVAFVICVIRDLVDILQICLSLRARVFLSGEIDVFPSVCEQKEEV